VGKYCKAGQATDGSVIRRMHFAYWINKATDTHSESVMLTALPLANSGYRNAPHCHVVLILSVLLRFVKASTTSLTQIVENRRQNHWIQSRTANQAIAMIWSPIC